MGRRRGLTATLLAVAIAALGLGAHAGGMPARDPLVHPPAIAAGPIGRVALDGAWIVRVVPAGKERRVRLPYSPNAAAVSGPAGEASFRGAVAWYRTALEVPLAGDYAIRFESVNHHATVFVDGRRVARHTGAYLPFEARVRLTAGRHVLLVRADWRSPARMRATARHRTWFNFGGIDRDVTDRRLGGSELDAPAVVTRLARGGAALVDVTVRVRNRAAARTIRVEGRLGERALRFGALRLEPGRAAWVRARLRVERPRLWAPGHPDLETLALDVPGESGWRSRVGLRELRWSGGRLLLNGRRLVLHGASLQEDAPGRGSRTGSTPAGRWPSTCGARTCPRAPGRCTATSTRSARRTTRAGITTCTPARPRSTRASARGFTACEAPSRARCWP